MPSSSKHPKGLTDEQIILGETVAKQLLEQVMRTCQQYGFPNLCVIGFPRDQSFARCWSDLQPSEKIAFAAVIKDALEISDLSRDNPPNDQN